MSWEPMAPLRRVSDVKPNAALEFATGFSPGSVRYRRAYILIRPHLMEDRDQRSPLVQRGGAVAVQRGSGEHDGKLLVTLGGAFEVIKSGGRSSQPLLIRMAVWDGLPEKRRSAVTYRFTGDGLEIDLPPWAGGTRLGPERAAAPAALAPAPARTPARAVAPAPAPKPPAANVGEKATGGFSMLGGQVPATRARP